MTAFFARRCFVFSSLLLPSLLFYYLAPVSAGVCLERASPLVYVRRSPFGALFIYSTDRVPPLDFFFFFLTRCARRLVRGPCSFLFSLIVRPLLNVARAAGFL